MYYYYFPILFHTFRGHWFYPFLIHPIKRLRGREAPAPLLICYESTATRQLRTNRFVSIQNVKSARHSIRADGIISNDS